MGCSSRLSAMCILLSVSVGSVCCVPVKGADPTDRIPVDSERLLQSVLQRESEGQILERSTLLKASLNEPTLPERWQAGQIKVAAQWKNIEELSEAATSDNIAEYLKLRGDQPLDAAGHRKMAQWCREKMLEDQERAHWRGVLLTASHDLQARNELGDVRLGDRWIASDQVDALGKRVQDLQAGWEKWMPKIKQILVKLTSKNSAAKQKALTELAAIDDPGAISSLEATTLQLDDDYVEPFIKTISRIKSKEACNALARIALSLSGSEGGSAAKRELRSYPYEFYIPDLLEMLGGQVSTTTSMYFEVDGLLAIQQIFSRETEHEKTIHKIKRSVSLVKLPPRHAGTVVVSKLGGYLPSVGHLAPNSTVLVPASLKGSPFFVESTKFVYTTDPFGKTSALSAFKTDAELARSAQVDANIANQLAKRRFDSVRNLLSDVTGESLGDTPLALWDWWSNYNERYRTPYKPVKYYESSRDFVRYVPTGSYYGFTSLSCLVKGTPIQTQTGLKPIQDIRVGDMVLSQEVETGELIMKPVVQTTLRPPASTLTIVLEESKIQATGGHRWWVSGKGWLKTRDLRQGMVLHTATGTTPIKDVIEDAQQQETYNLVVDGLHTYFVGTKRILSYDNTDVKPTMRVVPGYTIVSK